MWVRKISILVKEQCLLLHLSEGDQLTISIFFNAEILDSFREYDLKQNTKVED
jgi:hypothetical protein